MRVVAQEVDEHHHDSLQEREGEAERPMGISGQGEEIAPQQLLPGLPPFVSSSKRTQKRCSYKGKASALLKMTWLDTGKPLKHC